MRQLVTTLAIFGFLAAPPVMAAEDPFDFSSPLPSDSPVRRDAQYFSRAPSAQERRPQGTSPSTDAPTRFTRERSESPAERPANYAAELFSESRQATTDERPPSVSFSREMARERRTAAQGGPQDTLRRFDEFLKTREVISADYSKPADHQERSAIRQVQGEVSENPFDALPSFGDLDALPGEDSATTGSRQNPLAEMQAAPHGHPQAHVRPRQDRLTDPIPMDASPAEVPARDSGAVAIEPETNHSHRRQSAIAALHQTSGRSGARSFAQVDGDSATPNAPRVQTSWKLLGPLNLGQACTAELTLSNPGDEDAQRVSLEVRVPDSVQIVKATPAPVEEQAFLGWKFSELAPGQSLTIQIVFMASEPGAVELSSHVRHTSSRSEAFSVAQPRLDVALSGPKEVHVGEPASQTVVLKNQGTGVATNVKLEAVIPAGLEHTQGEHLLMEIGSLNPGEVRSMRLVLGAVAGGAHILQVEANADSGLVKTAAAEVTVIAPSLRAGIVGPSLRYLGREADFTIRVLNDGLAATDFIQVTHRVPEGFEFVSAERGAKFDSATRLVNWYVGALESKETQDLKVTLIARQVGEHVHDVHATSGHGARADARLATRIEGTASLVVKVADLEDPVEVGSETAYEITITNEGTAPAHLVGLTCEIPEGLSLVDAQGPSDHRIQAEMIGFRPVDDLPAGKSLKYRVFVKCGIAGDQRFRCRLTSASLSQPLFTEELTKFYAE